MRQKFLRFFLSPSLWALFAVFISTAASAQNLSVTGVSPYSTLDLTQSFDAAIASVTETWAATLSATNTYTVSVRSSNGGLAHSTQTGSIVPYSLTYFGSSGQTVTMTTSDQVIGTRSITPNLLGGFATANAKITYTGRLSSSLYQGVYSDILTFTYRKDGATVITQSLTLKATAIGASLSISISPNSSASNLPLSTTQSDLAVATATEYSNSTTGYVVKVQSANGGFLQLTTTANPTSVQKIAYTMKYAGTPASLSTANTNTLVKTQATGVYQGVSSTISISYSAPLPGAVSAGTYSDTLTFTIEAQ